MNRPASKSTVRLTAPRVLRMTPAQWVAAAVAQGADVAGAVRAVEGKR
jgi:hypothetical protein